MKVGDQITEIIERNKDMSTKITDYAVTKLAPPVLVQYLDMKRHELTGFIEGIS